jgi:hypothetical protein
MASISELLASAMDMSCCSVCRLRVLDLSSLSSACGRASIFPECMALRPEECNKVSRPSFACMVSVVESFVAEKLLLSYAPLLGEVAFDDLVPAQLCGRIWCVWCVGVVGPEPFLDNL